ncbi:MAG: SAM-dependent chlorinase/fluorinase, partial [Desulfobacteraceae bacterium]|nr:SAM-dependent chlorinase/fluorinase [Desulfobacteraceae bacterium]
MLSTAKEQSLTAPIITFLTDFGLSDGYVASAKGIILGICPEATLVDISHLIGAQQV